MYIAFSRHLRIYANLIDTYFSLRKVEKKSRYNFKCTRDEGNVLLLAAHSWPGDHQYDILGGISIYMRHIPCVVFLDPENKKTAVTYRSTWWVILPIGPLKRRKFSFEDDVFLPLNSPPAYISPWMWSFWPGRTYKNGNWRILNVILSLLESTRPERHLSSPLSFPPLELPCSWMPRRLQFSHIRQLFNKKTSAIAFG